VVARDRVFEPARDQHRLFGVEWGDEVVVGAALEACGDAAERLDRRGDDHRDLPAVAFGRRRRAHEREDILIRLHQVDDQEIDPLRGHFRQRLGGRKKLNPG
jgi:hypothetical protein